mmetsp:Transcript_1319/g.1431  ORF Transcript_1319/g.1431 Transcript_1319/m.1431 type:complete len:335 (+) Transcript_1319:36-1040(+)
MSYHPTNNSILYGRSYEMNAVRSIFNRYMQPMYGGPVQPQYVPFNMQREPDFTQGKTVKVLSVYDRTHEELKPADYYPVMLQDELAFPNMRLYNEQTLYLEEIPNVFQFYFREIQSSLGQNKQTLHLAMAYFTQTIMRCPNLRRNEIGVIAASAMFCACKFDEIDYNLPPLVIVMKTMFSSSWISQYDNRFDENDMIACERNICKKLEWNFHQYTPYHFVKTLLAIGVVSKGESIQVQGESSKSIAIYDESDEDSRILMYHSRGLNSHQPDDSFGGDTTNAFRGSSFSTRFGQCSGPKELRQSEMMNCKVKAEARNSEKQIRISSEDLYKLERL